MTKEDRDRTLENSRDLGQKLSALGQDYTALREQYRAQTSTMEKQQLELVAKIDALEKSNEVLILKILSMNCIYNFNFELCFNYMYLSINRDVSLR